MTHADPMLPSCPLLVVVVVVVNGQRLGEDPHRHKKCWLLGPCHRTIHKKKKAGKPGHHSQGPGGLYSFRHHDKRRLSTMPAVHTVLYSTCTVTSIMVVGSLLFKVLKFEKYFNRYI
jgi:hypothetical protein